MIDDDILREAEEQDTGPRCPQCGSTGACTCGGFGGSWSRPETEPEPDPDDNPGAC